MRRIAGLRLLLGGLAAALVLHVARDPISSAFVEPWADLAYIWPPVIALLIALFGLYLFLSAERPS